MDRAGRQGIIDMARGRRLGFVVGAAVVLAVPVLLLGDGAFKAMQGSVHDFLDSLERHASGWCE